MRYYGKGTGFLRIRNAVNKWGLPPPQFAEKTGYFRIRFVNPAVQSIPVIGESHLNERQKKAVGFVKKYGKITNREYRGINPDVTDRTVLNDFNDMVRKGVLVAKGEKKQRYYIFR